jgi:Ca2+/Na+ antiporter
MCDIHNIWDKWKWLFIIASILVGLYLIVFQKIGSLLYTLGIILFFIGVVMSIHENSKKNFWTSNFFFIIVLTIFIWYLMATFQISQTNIQGLLNVYITIDIAIISIVLAAVAIKAEGFKSVKKEFRDILLLTSFWILLSVLIYCFSFFDLYNTSVSFKVLLGALTLIQIILTYNFCALTINMFDALVPD